MAKKPTGKETVIADVDSLAKRIQEMRAAQAEFATFSQEQVDKIFHAAAIAANKARVPLAKMAVEETGMGIMEDKVIKNHFASEYIYNKYKNLKTCGVIEDDPAFGYKKVAEPLGIIAAVIPTTNPTSTAIFKTLICLKTRNAIIISPHPRAKACTIEAARIVRDAAEAAGCPKGIIDWVPAPTIELTGALMGSVDCILATGGPGMVNAAYSSGKPALGVGPGNNPAIIDDSADIELSVNSIIHSKIFDNGMICATEQNVIVLDKVYDKVKAEFQKRGCFFLVGDDIAKVGNTVIVNGGVNAKMVGQPATKIAAAAGVEVPPSTKVLIGEVTSVDPSEPWAHEKLTTILGMYRAKDFDDAIAKASRLVADGGYGHTASLFVDPNEKEKIAQHAEVMKACRILINTPAAMGGIGDLYNFMLPPSLTLGCGSWGGNSVSGNVGPQHLLNIKSVAERRENMLWLRTPEKVYFKKGCMPVALRELKDVYGKKRAFIVTDKFLYESGFTKKVEASLDEMGIAHESFWSISPDPKLQDAEKGEELLRAFQPDTIIAIGGGSAMDAGKIMWSMYENPDEDFSDMSMDFMDIRKRVYTFPKMGKKAFFVAIPTSSGTGSEVTPFAIITDAETGIKWPITDYELMPNMAIVDTDNMMTQPKGLTAASGVDVLTHCLEAYVSMMASDFTDSFALRGMKLVFQYLPRAYDDGSDVEARDHMANASTLGGLAFANAFLGVNHSMAHKLGAFHHIPHGLANAVILRRVMRYNAAERPTKMGTFPQYDHPKTLHRYAEAGRFCGATGKDDREVFENFLKMIGDLFDHVGVKHTIAEYGVDEQNFLDTLDDMSLQAFNDQCTGANPRYPLVSEIKELYLDAYYGRPASSYED
ncbi:MAG: bifunctional acetaldehyde-CoA/alcohol dehydrogenase [Olsenella sp.]|jgi:acetaldehyde dehydrogenase/alcohol dehydrogenase|nr:bifunctional acetaldehyde-CoA/alcohol dehydrogenase [Olsenella sp.]MCH3957229.1 bifunctional acetaldehyde-CoA/alcohol dehydrogenase [Olsenella sp.]MCI1667079.1 bifunctional acetaldehyde-CoA/alcohol dehydrogenase [Olsenella sp.]MCI2123078.1 bifunctional acetaldehyde-CoA/alcohol dehydrogenase [Olsenella sp.]MCI2126658.1 bifunctional acetaldehyde-CoA/alcohol dehydrogenase [Olsenella sp.]